MKVYDFQCPICKQKLINYLMKDDDDVPCCEACTEETDSYVPMHRLISAPRTFTTITPTYPGSKKLKAGYQHKFINRPATKTQVGVGGGITKGTT